MSIVFVQFIEMYIKIGEIELAKDQLIILLDRFHDRFDNMGYVEIYAQLGDHETALKWLEKAINEKVMTVPMCWFNYSLPKEFKENVRFVGLMKSINHPLYVDK